MVTSAIGKTFVDAYNKKFSTDYDAKGFFMEVFYPLFFDYPKYMMTAGNSPLENPKIKWDDMLRGKLSYETKDQRLERLRKLIKRISEIGADASTAIGYSSLDDMATTSGQMTSMLIDMDENDIYASWIGHGLGVGVKGGINILFNDTEILLDIFDGWKYYRESLNKNSYLKGNQINAWNAQWLAHKYSRQYQKKNEMAGLEPYERKDDIMIIDSITWTKLLFGISRQHQGIQLMAYLYNIGQTNTTLGFVPFILNEIRRPIDLYKKLFGQITDVQSIEELFGTAFGLAKACQQGFIGLRALEPKGIKDYIYPQGNQEKVKMPKYKDDNKIKITYRTYQIWILAMLKNQELWDKSQDFAKELHQYVCRSEKKISTKRKNLVDAVLAASNKKNFIAALTEIVVDTDQTEKIIAMAQEINLMPMDNVPYFLTLIRFSYASINK